MKKLCWRVTLCKRCSRPLWAELVLASERNIYPTTTEAIKRRPHASQVYVEALPDIPITHSIPDEIVFFERLDYCPMNNSKKCEA